MAISDNTKKGKRDGKILFFQIPREKLTVSKIEFDEVKISKTRIIKIISIRMELIFLFIKTPFLPIIIIRKDRLMLNKIYEQIIKIVKNNYLMVISFFIAYSLMFLRLPYYINTPGGITDISSRIEISDYPIAKNVFNLAYVSEIRATIPTFLYSYLNKDWDLIKKEDLIPPHEKGKETKFRDQSMLKEANQEAIILAYTKAGKEVRINNKHLYVTYIDSQAQTNLKIGDEVLKINNQKIDDLEDIRNIVETFKEKEKVIIQVKNDNKIVDRKATLFKEGEMLMIGILISIDYEFEMDPFVKFNFKETDGGPSGGFMMSLAIYDTLTGSKLGNGRKIVGTGTIDIDGNVGEVGGVKYKIKGAEKEGADLFFVPAGENYEEVMALKLEKDYKIKVISIKTLDDAINYLKGHNN